MGKDLVQQALDEMNCATEEQFKSKIKDALRRIVAAQTAIATQNKIIAEAREEIKGLQMTFIERGTLGI
jgi:hypothetical protein